MNWFVENLPDLMVAFGTLALAVVTVIVLIVTIRWNHRREKLQNRPFLKMYWANAYEG